MGGPSRTFKSVTRPLLETYDAQDDVAFHSRLARHFRIDGSDGALDVLLHFVGVDRNSAPPRFQNSSAHFGEESVGVGELFAIAGS